MKNSTVRDKTPALESGHAVRATFSLPSQAIEDLDDLRRSMGKRGFLLNRSELVRLGLAALRRLPEKQIRQEVEALDRLKAGRPRG